MLLVRRADAGDAHALEDLIADQQSVMTQRFGLFDVRAEIERAGLSITAHDEDGAIVGFASFYDHPRVMKDHIGRAEWENWFEEAYGDPNNSAENSVWLSVFIAVEAFQHDVATQVFTAAFSTMPVVNVALFALPKGTPGFSPLQDVFEPLEAPQPTYESPYRLFTAHRELYVPRLKVREAHVEDNDDLTPIFNQQSERVSGVFGEFFLADMIERQDDNNRAIAAEMDGRAVGVMAFSGDVDTAILCDCFELDAFDNLVKREGEVFVSSDDEDEDGGRPSAEEQQPSPEDVLSGLEIAGLAASVSSGSDTPKQVLSPTYADEEDEDIHYISNAFCITWFCLDENYQSRAYDFLEAAFKLHPNFDYCVLTSPHGAKELSIMQYFTLVDPKPNNAFPHVLYVMHRYALMNKIRVRHAAPNDDKYLRRLLEGVDQGEDILQLYADTLRMEAMTKAQHRPKDASKNKVFVATCAGNVIAVAVVNVSIDIAYLQRTFHLEHEIESQYHASSEHALLSHIALNPIFSRHARFILQELLREFNKTCLYFAVYPNEIAPNVVEHFVQVRPRTRLWYNETNEHLNDNTDPFALFIFTCKRLHEPKLAINARIVVVGASDVGLALLEHLSMMQYLNFTNLTLISRGGLPTNDPEKQRGFIPETMNFTHRSLRQISFPTSVRVLNSAVVRIDRQSSAVELSDGSVVPYEKLVLCTGMMFGLPTSFEIKGLLTINTEEDVQYAIEHLRDVKLNDTRARHIVYGATLEAYAAVHALLAEGITPELVTLAMPPQPLPCFAEAFVDDEVTKALERTGVSVVRSYILEDIEQMDGVLVAAVLREKLQLDGEEAEEGPQKRIGCATLIFASEKDIDLEAFTAINRACLVYDGRLVIDNHFRTIDPAIYAAGPVTKFANNLHTTHADLHEHFNSREIGIMLSVSVKRSLDPVDMEAWERTLELEEWELPTYLLPKMVGTALPGNVYYFRMIDPKIQAAESAGERCESENWEGSSIETSVEGRFCRISMDPHGLIKGITMLLPMDDSGDCAVHKDTFENIIWLFNLPETYLNHLRKRFDAGHIKDLTSIFEEPWMAALYQDGMSAIREDIREEVSETEAMREMVEELTRIVERDGKVTEEQKALLREQFLRKTTEEVKNNIKSSVVSFLKDNRSRMPMYHIPSKFLERQGRLPL